MLNREQILILFLVIKSLYLPLNRRKSRYYWKLPIDDKIPLIPWFIVPYIGYYIYIIVTIFLLWNTKHINLLLYSFIYSYNIACIFWYLFPNGVKRPLILGKTFFHKATAFIYKLDGDANGFPSAHIFITLLCAYYLLMIFNSHISLIGLSGLLIILSTLFTKQHYIIDIIGGIIVFITVLALSNL